MAKPKPKLTAERLRELLHYDPETGVFTWKVRTTNYTFVGEVAGCKHNKGYWRISVDKVPYLAHRLAWLYTHGAWPELEIDHVNCIRDDNRIENLRSATRDENMQNIGDGGFRPKYARGTYYIKSRRKWSAHISVNKKMLYLGYFDTQEQAHQAHAAAKLTLHSFNPVIHSQQ